MTRASIHLCLIVFRSLQRHISSPSFFFSGDGPHSRRYGRTAALRLLVQPCDEDDDDDD
jgi:hypothetical protein